MVKQIGSIRTAISTARHKQIEKPIVIVVHPVSGPARITCEVFSYYRSLGNGGEGAVAVVMIKSIAPTFCPDQQVQIAVIIIVTPRAAERCCSARTRYGT